MSWNWKWNSIGDIFTIVVIIFVIVLVVYTIVAYINENFVKADAGAVGAERFLAGTNATNVTWGLTQDEFIHLLESSEWTEKGWTKLK